jgi:hypothetical protein
MRHVRLWAGVAAGLALATQAVADDTGSGNGIRVGTLSCDVGAGWGMILGSARKLACTFTGAEGSGVAARKEAYEGKITKVGADIGYRAAGRMVWAVFMPTGDVGPGALAGHYGGATASATAGVGVGANALFGGSGNHVSLQPLSVEGSTGLNVAAGVAGINLKSAGPVEAKAEGSTSR